MRAICYIRVSTEEQATEGVSLDAQESRLRAYCEMRGLEVVEVVRDEGVSAGKALDAREGGARVLEAIRGREADAVVAYKLDRLFRDAGDCLNVTKAWDVRGVALHLVDLGGQTLDTSSAMGRFFLTVMAGAAELERNLVSERTKAAMAHMKEQGRRVGSVPYGYSLADDGQTLVEDELEQGVLAEARRLRAAGLSLRAVASELAAFGFKSRTGKTFTASSVRNMVNAA